jgi:hypothetical protein
MLRGFPHSDAFSGCYNGTLYYLLLKTSPSLRSKSSCSRHCLLEVKNTPPSWFRLNDLPRMTSQRVVKRRSSASTNSSWLRPAARCMSLLRNWISQPLRAWVYIHSVCFTMDEERVWRPVKVPGITIKHLAVMHWLACVLCWRYCGASTEGSNVLFDDAVSCWGYWVNDADGEKRKYSHKNLSLWRSVLHKSHRDWLGMEPGPSRWVGGNVATTLSFSTAVVCCMKAVLPGLSCLHRPGVCIIIEYWNPYRVTWHVKPQLLSHREHSLSQLKRQFDYC